MVLMHHFLLGVQNKMNDRLKRKLAVLVSIEKENESYRLRLDDVTPAHDDITWKQVVHYTSKIYSENQVTNLNFSEKELADFGYAIWARLSAFIETGSA